MLAGQGHRVELWCREPEVTEEINRCHANSRFLIGVELPPGLHASSEPLESASQLDALSEFSEQVGDNTESLLLAAGLNEIQRLGLAMGAIHP